jgi:hypothetical protein
MVAEFFGDSAARDDLLVGERCALDDQLEDPLGGTTARTAATSFRTVS